jgi:hypothetical protein
VTFRFDIIKPVVLARRAAQPPVDVRKPALQLFYDFVAVLYRFVSVCDSCLQERHARFGILVGFAPFARSLTICAKYAGLRIFCFY